MHLAQKYFLGLGTSKQLDHRLPSKAEAENTSTNPAKQVNILEKRPMSPRLLVSPRCASARPPWRPGGCSAGPHAAAACLKLAPGKPKLLGSRCAVKKSTVRESTVREAGQKNRRVTLGSSQRFRKPWAHASIELAAGACRNGT